MTTPAPTPDPLDYQPRLRGLAYRMLGDLHDAEEVVQDAYLRWHQAPRDDVRSAEAWLVTVVSRLAVDRLRSAAAERARYVGPWLPEPVATPTERPAELASDLSVALLVLLERLAPEERAAFLLREVFGAEYAEIARVLERSEPAARQVVHRARVRVRTSRPRVAVAPEVHGQILARFLEALASEDAPSVLAMLAPDVVLTSDGGGKVTAARNRILGADRVARFFLGLGRKALAGAEHRVTRLNGQPAWLTFVGGRLHGATSVDVNADGTIGELFVVLNPDKLGFVEVGALVE